MSESLHVPYTTIRRALHHNMWVNLGSQIKVWTEEFAIVLGERRLLSQETVEVLRIMRESVHSLEQLSESITNDSLNVTPSLLRSVTEQGCRAILDYRTAFVRVCNTLRERLAAVQGVMEDEEIKDYMSSLETFLKSQAPSISLEMLDSVLKHL